MNPRHKLQCSSQTLHHYLLTRFNLHVFNKDKEGRLVRTASWLEHRFELFERYCLPSLKNQTCLAFEWIVLFDSTTPERFKKKVSEYQNDFPQLISIFVEPENGRYFAQIFKQEVGKRLLAVQEFKSSSTSEASNSSASSSSRVLTTYLDNDDALDIHFVEDIQRRAAELLDGTIITYDNGYQLFTDHNYVMQIRYSRNHFMSVVENGNPSTFKTIYGYGSHYYIDRIPGAKIEHVKNLPMWCEVIHEKNMGNDAYFLQAKMVNERELLLQDFGIQEPVQYGASLYLFRFLPRYVKTFIRRIGYSLFGRHW